MISANLCLAGRRSLMVALLVDLLLRSSVLLPGFGKVAAGGLEAQLLRLAAVAMLMAVGS